jgi:hypothetical protein
MLKKKKGSALLVTVISFMFIMTVLVAMISFISSNYKMRVIESKRVENLYTSESGLDIVSTVINKDLSSAISYGKEKVVNKLGEIKDLPPEEFREFYNDHKDDSNYDSTIMYRVLLDDIGYQDYRLGKNLISEAQAKENQQQDRADIEKVKNIIFKQGVKEFLEIKGTDEWDGNKSKKIEVNNNENILTKSIENLNYLASKSINGEYNTETVNLDIDKQPILFVGDKDKDIKTLEEQKKDTARTGIQYWKKVNKEDGKLLPTRGLHYFFGDYDSADANGTQEMRWIVNEKKIPTSDEEGVKIKVTSEFETKEESKRIGTNLRTIQSIYDLRIPNYKEIKFETLDNVQLEALFDIPKITVGKNMDVQSNFRIDGDIFVQGEDATNNNDSATTNEQRKKERLYDKYSGGITLGTNSGRTIEFNGVIATRGTFNIKNNANVILDNDLYAKNLYIGDTNSDTEKNVIKNSTLKAENSSIVLDNDFTFKGWGTKVSIKDFYGINDKDTEYGESNATSGKPKQRTSSSIIVNDFDQDSSINITNSAYLMGVGHVNTVSGYQTGESVAVRGNYEAYAVAKNDGDKIIYDNPLYVLDENDVFKKSSHFYEYWKDKITDKETGKITLPQNNPAEDSFQHPKSGTYSIGAIVSANTPKVLNQNYTNDMLGFINSKREEYAEKVYKLKSDNQIDSMVLYNSLGNGADEVKNLDILNNLYKNKDNIAKVYDIDDQKGKDKFYKAICSYNSGKTIVITNNEAGYGDSSKYDLFKTNIINAVVVTNSDVIIDGDVQFNGSIITSGNLIIKGNNKVNLNYDKFVVDQVQKENANLFNVMFRNTQEDEEKDKNPEIEANSNEFVKVGLWKIVK